MAIPTPEFLGLYYPSKDLTTPGQNAPDRIVGTGSTLLNIAAPSLTEPDNYWNGAIGYFCGTSTTALRGVTFHVRKWDATLKTLQITSPPPSLPSSAISSKCSSVANARQIKKCLP